ncbi:MAG: histidine ammonia-lyase [Elusimicrobiota bacterium]
MKAFELGSHVRLTDLWEVAVGGRKVRFGTAARARTARAKRSLERALSSGRPVYGVNTGFGELASTRIPLDSIRTLQRNLLLSHACGVGEPLSEAEARGILFLRANELARGYSGCRPLLVERLAAMLNRGVLPWIPSRGSVGASGDLAPQAHAALPLIGEGRAFFRGRVMSGAGAMRAAGLKPLTLDAKEGLSLINGTQTMQSVGGLALLRAKRVCAAADLAGAASLEAIQGTPVPYDARLSRVKAHPGQVKTAARMRRLLAHSEIRESHRDDDERVQDPYSLRCIPQVHGAVIDALEAGRRTVEIEMGSVTDNPLIFGKELLSGGNFHGQALSLAFDGAAQAMTVLGGISERRIFQVVSQGGPGLPAFLAGNPGLESGFMIPQVTAAALVSENKTLAHPASSDSVPTSANKEDFVSMGMWAALKLGLIIENTAHVISIELLAATQGLEFHKPLRPGRGVAELYRRLRRHVKPLRGDEPLAERIETTQRLILLDYFGGII